MIVKRYFYVQQLGFKLCGIDTEATRPELIVKRPFLLFVPLFFAITHVAAALHYAYMNHYDYVEVIDSLSLTCQSVLSIWELFMFLGRRKQFIEVINDIHSGNFKAAPTGLPIIRRENLFDIKFSTLYLGMCISAIFSAFGSPIFDALYAYYETGELILRVPYKASYFWSHTQLPGYFLVYMWCILSIYSLTATSLAIDTTFVWLVSNIIAQFHILTFRFNEVAEACRNTPSGESTEILKIIKSCLEHHNHILQLIKSLNQIYGEIIFFKFLISCSQICCLAFRLSQGDESLALAAYLFMFLVGVSFQLLMYCYNGQRITDESLQIANDIYFAFDWDCLPKNYKKLLLQTIMRAQKNTELKGGFFVLDLNLFLWAFKTAGSLITALKALDEEE